MLCCVQLKTFMFEVPKVNHTPVIKIAQMPAYFFSRDDVNRK